MFEEKITNKFNSPASNRKDFSKILFFSFSFIIIVIFFYLLFVSKLNTYSFSGLLLGLVCLLLGSLIISNGLSEKYIVWFFFNVSAAFWGIVTFVIGQQNNYSDALLLWKIAIIAMILVSISFYHTIHNFVNKTTNFILKLFYVQGIIFGAMDFSGLIVKSLEYRFNQFYYLKASIVFNVFFFIWLSIIFCSFKLLIDYYKKVDGLRKIQTKYLLFSTLIGWCGSSTAAFLVYDIKLYPLGNYFVCIYAIISTYAIFRYQLLDIKVVATRLSIFIIVYSLILGAPIWLGFKLLGKGLWLLPVTCMGILATVGPFVYLYFQKRAEDRLLQEQRRYQATLRQASAGMGKIKDLKKLLGMIVYVLTHAIQIEHALVYIYDESHKKYVLGASKRKSGYSQFIQDIQEESLLVGYLSENKSLVILEEVKQKAQDYKNSQLTQLRQTIISLEGELIVPIFIDQDLVAIIVMGKKESGKPYTEDDLGVFSILANQTALAIENAKFYEDMKLTQQQLFQAEKMATIGTMADGLSHQINNRFHALGFIAGDALDTIHLNQKELKPEKMKEVLMELDRAFTRVQENVIQGGEIVQGLLKYTRKGETGFTAVEVPAVFKSALEMTQFKIKTDQLKIVHDYDPGAIPKIKGNFTQLQEVFFNLIDNGYDAMMQRKNEKKEVGYQPTLIIHVLKEDGYAQVIFEDNGIGTKEEDVHKLFTPFFTTKLSSKKGTGLGLYVIKKIVEDNHGGTVEMVSKYMQGTQMKLRLPVAIE